MHLAANSIESYRADGFCFPVRALSPAAADGYRRAFLDFNASKTAASFSDLHNDVYLFKPHLLLKWVDALVHEPGILDVAESLLGPDILCWSAGIFQKAPHSPSHVSWHQDAVYYGLSPVDHVIRVWVALSPTRVENGTMLYARGAHTAGLFEHVPERTADNLLTNNEVARFDLDRHDQLPVLLEPGEVAVHHLHTPHCSGPNVTDDRRINVVITYLSPDVSQENGPDSALVVRGTDSFGHFEHEARPETDLSDAARARHARAMALRRNIFRVAAESHKGTMM